tara:strand:- start:187 stop:1620 length:1434 start_codon:yes stop_codon:yes gene_type:complete
VAVTDATEAVTQMAAITEAPTQVPADALVPTALSPIEKPAEEDLGTEQPGSNELHRKIEGLEEEDAAFDGKVSEQQEDAEEQEEEDEDWVRENPIPSWEYVGFTHMPVDFQQLMSKESLCPYYPAIQPFFNHLITNHAEGPKKWYLATCSDDPVKVYLPAKALLSKNGIRVYRDVKSGGNEGTRTIYDGEEVLFDVQLWLNVSEDITIFFMHLALLEHIQSLVDNSDVGYVIFDAGTHIGYLKSAEVYGMGYSVIDFGVEDRRTDAGLTEYDDHWWNIRANPLDYFVDEVRESILNAYHPVLEDMVNEGEQPFTDIEDSRANINENGKIWGTWFKDDLPNAFDSTTFGAAWSIIHWTKTDDLSKQTFWKFLERQPDLSGIIVESNRLEAVGKPLYAGEPIGKNMFFILSGNASYGIGKMADYFGGHDTIPLYLKYRVTANTESKLDDTLSLEVFESKNLAESSDFSGRAVEFRRQPQ